MAFKSKDLMVNLGPQRGGEQTGEDCPFLWLSNTNSLFCTQIGTQNVCFPMFVTNTNPTGFLTPIWCGAVTFIPTITVAQDPDGAAAVLATLKEQLRQTLAAVEKQEAVLAGGAARRAGAAKRPKTVPKRRKKK
jgi:hypothetical protein